MFSGIKKYIKQRAIIKRRKLLRHINTSNMQSLYRKELKEYLTCLQSGQFYEATQHKKMIKIYKEELDYRRTQELQLDDEDEDDIILMPQIKKGCLRMRHPRVGLTSVNHL